MGPSPVFLTDVSNTFRILWDAFHRSRALVAVILGLEMGFVGWE